VNGGFNAEKAISVPYKDMSPDWPDRIGCFVDVGEARSSEAVRNEIHLIGYFRYGICVVVLSDKKPQRNDWAKALFLRNMQNRSFRCLIWRVAKRLNLLASSYKILNCAF